MILSVRGYHTGETRSTGDRNKKGPTVISFVMTIIRSFIFCIFNTVLVLRLFTYYIILFSSHIPSWDE